MTEIDFKQELYKAFGQVKDFTLGMRIAKWFYDMGKKNQEHVSDTQSPVIFYGLTGSVSSPKEEPVSEDLEEAAHKYADLRRSNYETAFYAFMSGAQWKEEQLMSKAIDAKLLEGNLIRQKGVTHPLHVGDKVKVIVIKED